jgi:DNA helicase IV
MDFDDLLIHPLTLFRTQPQRLTAYQQRFHAILVDEFQDTNRPQYLLVRHLSGTHRDLCVVGDDDQSIYGWRGADIRNMLDFEHDFPDATLFRLEENYRSTQVILDAAFSTPRTVSSPTTLSASARRCLHRVTEENLLRSSRRLMNGMKRSGLRESFESAQLPISIPIRKWQCCTEPTHNRARLKTLFAGRPFPTGSWAQSASMQGEKCVLLCKARSA